MKRSPTNQARYDYHLANAIRVLMCAEVGYQSTDFPEGLVTCARRIAKEIMRQERYENREHIHPQ